MFIQCNQSAESGRRQQREHNACARPVSLKYLAFYQCITRIRPQLLPHLLQRLAECECFRLRKEVGKKDPMVFWVGDRVVCCRRSDEISRNDFRALVHELVERMLSVGTRGAPDDGLHVQMLSPQKDEAKKDVRQSGSRHDVHLL